MGFSRVMDGWRVELEDEMWGAAGCVRSYCAKRVDGTHGDTTACAVTAVAVFVVSSSQTESSVAEGVTVGGQVPGRPALRRRQPVGNNP